MENSFLFQLGAWNWFILAAILGVLEVLMPGLLLMWYSAAAVLVGAVALGVDLAWQWQLGLYALLGMALLFLSSKLTTPQQQTNSQHLNRRAAGYIGRVFTLTTATSNGHGKLKVGDSLWSVRLLEGELPAGAAVLVTDMEGATLIGKPAADKPATNKASHSPS